MVRQIMRDPLFLSQKSQEADIGDQQVMNDLLDTLKANQERCVGMAANMIGVHKRIIAFMRDRSALACIIPKSSKGRIPMLRRKAAFRLMASVKLFDIRRLK